MKISTYLAIGFILGSSLLQLKCATHAPKHKKDTSATSKKGKAPKLSIADITMDNFEDKVLKSKKMVVLDFWTDWCAPCKSLMPVMEELAYEYRDHTVFYRVNAEKDNNIYLTIDYEVRGYPSILYFKDGKNIDRQTGAILKEMISQRIAALLMDGKPMPAPPEQSKKND